MVTLRPGLIDKNSISVTRKALEMSKVSKNEVTNYNTNHVCAISRSLGSLFATRNVVRIFLLRFPQLRFRRASVIPKLSVHLQRVHIAVCKVCSRYFRSNLCPACNLMKTLYSEDWCRNQITAHSLVFRPQYRLASHIWR